MTRRSTPPAVAAFLTLVAGAVLFFRHDYWNWTKAQPLLFGFLPVGLWWQALLCLAASGMMWLMVTFAWPGHLEEEALEAEQRRTSQSRP